MFMVWKHARLSGIKLPNVCREELRNDVITQFSPMFHFILPENVRKSKVF